MSRNIVFEGWLTKSPPNKRIWRTKWRRRWFALRQSGELPGQYFLDYYADRNCRRLKGTINLDLCEQVDAGLHMERAGNGNVDPKLRGSVFTIQTQTRTYHLEADTEADMASWVDAICRVCGLRPSEEDHCNENMTLNDYSVSATNEHYERSSDTTGPYIPISECITGYRAQDQQRAFTFDPRNIVVSAQRSAGVQTTEFSGQRVNVSQPQIRVTPADFSENESNLSDDDERSLNASQSNITEWLVPARTFTRHPQDDINGTQGPPVPPRPPKTFLRARDQRESFQGPRIQEPAVDPAHDSIIVSGNVVGHSSSWQRVPRRMSCSASPTSPGRLASRNYKFTDDEDEYTTGHQSMQYSNLPSLPPAVDRALKPRYSSISQVNTVAGTLSLSQSADGKSDTLQYLDLDLHTSTPPPSRSSVFPRKVDANHGKSMSAGEADSVYKTVDFLKTEAFNITRQDAEASRLHQY